MTLHNYLIPAILTSVFLGACAEEAPPRTVMEFVENPMLLEAAMVRCSQDRDKTRYDPECVNARAAVQQVEAKEEQARRAEVEARSESKRQALRRAQEAAAEARRRAAETERLRKEAEYLAQFGVALPADAKLPGNDAETGGNTPGTVIPDTPVPNEGATVGERVQVPVDGANAPVAVQSDDGSTSENDGAGDNP